MSKRAKPAPPKSAPTKRPKPAFEPDKSFPLITRDTPAQTAQSVARQIAAPETAACRVIAAAEGQSPFAEWIDTAGLLGELRRVAAEVGAGDLSHAEAMLIAQAIAMQTLSTRLIERGMGQPGLEQFESFLRLGLRAQNQSRQALETLAALKQGPAIFARQANVAQGGPMQVNNGALPAVPAHARDSEIARSKLSLPDELHPDASPASGPKREDQAMAPVGKVHRPKDA